jgi:hypothetical protein
VVHCLDAPERQPGKLFRGADVDPVFISGHDDPMLPIVLIDSQAYCFIEIHLWS